ncbi:hypothetical protein [Bradyrhizobium centrosematis]|uniref:hypothetical protein n=1 Tax=Bradyrhizobium centrosematis TaxID=1300039 RepID=UPI00388D45EE
MSGFARDARKAQNGFILRENCFVRSGTTTQFPKIANHFRSVAQEFKVGWQVPVPLRKRVRAAAVMVPPHALHTHFTFFC